MGDGQDFGGFRTNAAWAVCYTPISSLVRLYFAARLSHLTIPIHLILCPIRNGDALRSANPIWCNVGLHVVDWPPRVPLIASSGVVFAKTSAAASSGGRS